MTKHYDMFLGLPYHVVVSDLELEVYRESIQDPTATYEAAAEVKGRFHLEQYLRLHSVEELIENVQMALEDDPFRDMTKEAFCSLEEEEVAEDRTMWLAHLREEDRF